jgi:hypothetical protein
MAAVDIAAARLIADGICTALGTDVFRGSQLPPSPDSCVTLCEYPGRGPLPVLGDTVPSYDYPACQALARDASPDAAKAKAWAIYTSLAAVVNTTISGQRVLAIVPKQTPFFLRVDDNNRTIWCCNYEVQRQGATS